MKGLQWAMKSILRPTLLATTKKRDGMPFNFKVGLMAKGGKLSRGQAKIYLYDFVAARTRQVVMVCPPADTIVMRPICELDTIQ